MFVLVRMRQAVEAQRVVAFPKKLFVIEGEEESSTNLTTWTVDTDYGAEF